MLLVFSHSLWAQLQSYIEDASDSLGTANGISLVRNYNDEYAIGFFKDSAASYFYAVKTASGMVPFTQGNRIQVNGSWDVKDIYFHNGIAFFCGNNGTDGIIGRFPVINLINGSGAVIVDCRTISGAPLRRLVAYGNAPSYRVAAIDSTVIVLGDFTSMNYKYHSFPTIYGEMMYDVLLKGDTLLYVGADFNNNCISVRVSSCSTPDHLSAPWRYHPATPADHIITTGSIATLLPDNRLAVVHQVSNEDNNFEMDLLVINLPNMQCIDRQVFVNLHRVSYHDLKYIPFTQCLELLYTDFALYGRYVLEWQPFQSSNYLANVLQPTSWYNSMDRIGDKCFFMVSGFQWMLQNSFAGCWPNSCETHWLTNVTHEQEHGHGLEGSDVNISASNPFTPTIYNTSVNSFKVAVDCLHITE